MFSLALPSTNFLGDNLPLAVTVALISIKYSFLL